MKPIAHGPDHSLTDHLRSVAALAQRSVPAGAQRWAHLAGLWHDLGKFRHGFQHYVRLDENAHIEGRGVVTAEKTHSAAGALHALRVWGQAGDWGRSAGLLLAHLIAAHHAGLYDHADLLERLMGGGKAASEREYEEAVDGCVKEDAALLTTPAGFEPRADLVQLPGLTDREEPLAQSLALRMLFSALVDADFLDTEAYLDRTRSDRRAGFAPLGVYRNCLDAHLAALTASVHAAGRSEEPVMQARARVLADCRAAAAQPPGVFSLQVPTGGGKTLASLAFALSHALTHGLERVIVAVPYTSIVEQTAEVLAGIFGRDAVVEHHSQASDETRGDQSPHATARSRLACENWDAPLIVTTNVQLLESLFAARTSRCRKLHRLQRSVIVLDEAQVLPPPFLQPTLDALRALSRHWGASIVSCTATQPVLTDIRRFDPRQGLRGLTPGDARPTEIVTDVAPLYATLERVRFHWPENLNTETPVDALAACLAANEAVLAVVNTREDAAALLQALDSAAGGDADRALHLSAAMCGQHRSDVIAEIRTRLQARAAGDPRPLRVVSTQLVEAGVDLDFPVVYRALAGLDAIAQAAGRCNREGRLGPGGGRVEVFVRPIPGMLASLARAAAATRAVLANERPATLPPELFRRYFEHWYGLFPSLDEKGIGAMLRPSGGWDLQLRSAEQAYRLVDDEDQCSVVVPYSGAAMDTSARDQRDAALGSLNAGRAERWQLRALQRFVVQAPRRDVRAWLERGDVAEPMPGWYLLRDETRYDARRGLLRDGAVLDARTLAQ
ncbi:MAG: CRISPR-associated endonuclease Cas3'' [Burkholderiaceae bacterium]|nr:CRISPR-associated endonuclease Cas3'' [Burkholderiaceae bacterium]